MAKINYKQVGELFILLVVVLSLVNFVNAFGAAVPYSLSSPAIMTPGEVKDIPLSLQSSINEGPRKYRLTIQEGTDVAKLVDGANYDVPATGEAVANVRVSIPQTAVDGNEYTIKILLEDMSSTGDAGSVTFKRQMTFSMKAVVSIPKVEVPVVATPQPTKDDSGLGWLALAVVLIIAIIAVVYYMMKSSKKRR